MDENLKRALDLLCRESEFIYLMGSYMTPRFNPESDVDLAVFFKNPSSQKKMNLVFKLEEIFQREVELVELNKIDPIFARQVLTTGRLVYVENSGLRNLWEASQNSKYFDFKMDRDIIEKNLMNKLKIVGSPL